jgi:hypothetical protein
MSAWGHHHVNPPCVYVFTGYVIFITYTPQTTKDTVNHRSIGKGHLTTNQSETDFIMVIFLRQEIF